MKKYKLPELKYYAGFVQPKDLDKLPDNMYLMVDSSLICATIHSWKGEEDLLTAKSPKFKHIYDKLNNMIYGDKPIEFGKPIKMKVRDIKEFFVKKEGIPLTCLKLTPDDAKIARKRKEIEDYNRNLISIGTVKDLLTILAPIPFDTKVIMNLNTGKLQIIKGNKRVNLK